MTGDFVEMRDLTRDPLCGTFTRAFPEHLERFLDRWRGIKLIRPGRFLAKPERRSECCDHAAENPWPKRVYGTDGSAD